MALESSFAQLESLGIFDVILPFILVFTIVFAVLQKVKIFGDKGKQFNIMIALVMGLAVVFPHVLGYYPPDQDIVLIMNQALPNVSVVIVAIVMALLIIGVFGGKMAFGGNSISGWIATLAFVVVVFIFGTAASWWNMPNFLAFLNNPDTMALVLVILVFAIIIWFITKEDTDKKKDDETFFGKFGKMFESGK